MIYLKLMGGLGNQMFQYAALKSMMLENNQDGCIEISKVGGLKKRSHNIYTLDKFNIDDKIDIISNHFSMKNMLNYVIYIGYYLFHFGKKIWDFFLRKCQPYLNAIGCYCFPEGYVEFKNVKCKNNYLLGYFQSYRFFEKYEAEIRKDLQVKVDVLPQNIDLLNEIKNEESVCVHIRRGDYVGTSFEVCDIEYYKKAMESMIIEKPHCKFYIFSNDINWARDNIKGNKIIYVDKNNPNYEELRLMYSCKHFIISNSSFSWWAQFLSTNDNKIVYAPSQWSKLEKNNDDIYIKSWNLIDVNNKSK